MKLFYENNLENIYSGLIYDLQSTELHKGEVLATTTYLEWLMTVRLNSIE